MPNGNSVMERMLADRAARNRRRAFWNDHAADIQARRARLAAANDASVLPRAG